MVAGHLDGRNVIQFESAVGLSDADATAYYVFLEQLLPTMHFGGHRLRFKDVIADFWYADANTLTAAQITIQLLP
jgi:hypothetical protein